MGTFHVPTLPGPAGGSSLGAQAYRSFHPEITPLLRKRPMRIGAAMALCQGAVV